LPHLERKGYLILFPDMLGVPVFTKERRFYREKKRGGHLFVTPRKTPISCKQVKGAP